jgi:hypothetical protein
MDSKQSYLINNEEDENKRLPLNEFGKQGLNRNVKIK